MIEQLEGRMAALVAEREQNGQRITQLRQALAAAEREDYAYAAVIGELELFLATLKAEPSAIQQSPAE